MTRARILIVEDHPALRERISALVIDRQSDVIAAVSNAAAARLAAAEHQPDIVLLDLSLPDQSGLDVLPDLLQVAPAARVVFLTGYEDPELSRVCIAAGGSGFMAKSQLAQDLHTAIQEVLEGRVFCSPSVHAAGLTL